MSLITSMIECFLVLFASGCSDELGTTRVAFDDCYVKRRGLFFDYSVIVKKRTTCCITSFGIYIRTSIYEYFNSFSISSVCSVVKRRKRVPIFSVYVCSCIYEHFNTFNMLMSTSVM